MANYPVKMLKDENGTPFVPLVAPGAVRDGQGFNLLDELDNKLEKTNIIAGQNVTITTSGNDITINSAAGGASANVIDNLDQTTGGVGVLDAHQGHVLKEMIPDVVNNLTTVDGTKALSAYQGYLLNHKIVPTGGTTGQVLKKKSATDNDLEWGDAADPNAISGDSSVKKIVALTYEEYQQLVTDDEVEQDTEYHITDAPDTINELRQEVDDLQDQIDDVNTLITAMTAQIENLMPINGSNTNGSYTKFPDGTMICRGVNSGVDLGLRRVTFPMAFIENPQICATINSSASQYQITCQYDNLTPTYVDIQVHYGPSNVGSNIFSWIAIGKWK